MPKRNIVSWFEQRETVSDINRTFERNLQVNTPFARRLGLEQELEGHSGCVNCLQWNESGELLASGSDDFQIIVWDVCRRMRKYKLDSGHQGNIFAVKFLPYSNDNTIVSAAADASIRVNSVSTAECINHFDCHTRRIKRLAITKESPFILWSGSEDGTVREFDLREPHTCQSNLPCSNVLINLTGHIGPASEVKCIQLHPLHPQYMAVGCSDPFVRLYDRRMLTLSNVSNSKTITSNDLQPPHGCVNYFTPGHLPSRAGRVKQRRRRHYVTTFATFSPDGEELLQNLGGEHIYIYRINEPRKALMFFSHEESNHKCSNLNGMNRTKNGIHKNGLNELTSTYESRKRESKKIVDTVNKDLPEKALNLKLKGNDAFSQENYFEAVTCYNDALRLVPDSSVLHANRAAALLKRAWDGDIYAALRDSLTAVSIDPSHSKAYYRQARCLFELKWYEEADICLQLFKSKFPEQADGYSIKKLEMEVKQLIKQHAPKTDEDAEDSSECETPRHRRRLPHSASNDDERFRRESSRDYECRLLGASNTTTDIKEANYFGNNGQFVIAGSDCGCMLLWDRSTTNLIEAWQGDESIVNCVQPHPSVCLVASSGIDPVVRLWSPRSSADNLTDERAKEVEGLARANQKRMNTDPLEEMLRTMGYQATIDSNSDDDDDEESSGMQCQTN